MYLYVGVALGRFGGESYNLGCLYLLGGVCGASIMMATVPASEAKIQNQGFLYDQSVSMALTELFILSVVFGCIVCFNLDTFHPIIYEVPFDDEKGSYFGMSVALRPNSALLNTTWILQVGAPKGNVPGSHAQQPGAVYRCNVFGPCRLFVVDEGMRDFGGFGDFEFKERKDFAWVGVAMDVKRFGPHERSVICGHRWVNQKIKNPENIDITYLMTGVCYLQDLDGLFESPVQRLLPLVNKEKIYTPKPYIVDLSTYHWGLGQAGISVQITEDTLIGAPGVTHWIGSVIRFDRSLEAMVASFAKAEIARKSRYTYLGYAVTTGRFYQNKELWYVAGAPRSAGYHGEVFTFQYKGFSDEVHIRTSLKGATFGEYFGSSLAAGDINSDGFDDLVVGSPLYSTKSPDEGKISVYLGTGRGSYLISAQVIPGRVSQGRFGSSLAFLGDLDQDGYGDLAVGAPYEEENKGAIYVFRGWPKGLQTDYSQRVVARDIHPHLRGFGVSISSPVDVDGNDYSDIAVGSYLSGHVVLLRSRPVIYLHPRIKMKNVIDRKDSHFNLTICSRFTGSNPPQHVGIVRIVDIDPVYGRGTIYQKSAGQTKILTLRPHQIVCEILPIQLNVSGRNFSPLQISLRNEIVTCTSGKGSSLLIKKEKPKDGDSFSKFCPFGNKIETTKEIPFAGECGFDSICQPILDLDCDVHQFHSGSYVVGSTEFFTLSLKIKNHGEPAHDGRIKVWSNIRLKHEDSLPSSGQTFWFDIDGVLTENYKGNHSFKIDFDALEPESRTLDVTVEVSSTNLKPESVSVCRLSVKLVSQEDLEFFVSSTVDSVYVSEPKDNHEIFNFTHFYEVRKTGVTPVKDAQLTIYVPTHSDEEFLTFEMETSESMHFSDRNEVRQLTKPEWTTEGLCPPSNRTDFLNCSTSNVRCNVIKLVFGEQIPVGISSYVKIIMSFNVSAVDSIRNEKDIIYISTVGILEYSKYFETTATKLEKTKSFSLYNEDRELHVDAHVIALSVLAGGFLLFLIVTALVKGNFFKRTKKEELESLKEADACFVYFTTTTTSAATAALKSEEKPTKC